MTDIDHKAQVMATEAQQAHAKALTALVRSPYEYNRAAQDLKDVKARFKAVEGHRTYLKEPFLEGGRRIDEFFRAPLKFLGDAETALKTALLGYEQAERQRVEEEQRRVDAAARAARDALEAAARQERDRVDAEAAELRRKAQEALAAGKGIEASRLQVQAATAVHQSEKRAEKLLATAATVVAAKVVNEVPVVSGQSTKPIWRAQVVDKEQVPEAYKVVDDTLIQNLAKATKGKVPVPGLAFFLEYVKSSRT